jgi:VanZ family protein
LRRKVLLGLGWAWVAGIVWLSLTPSPPKVDFAQSDKLGHFLAYGSLMLWFCFLYAAAKTRIAYAAGFVAMGIGLEFIQGMLGYRTFEVLDMLANTIGVLLGWAAAMLVPGIRVR